MDAAPVRVEMLRLAGWRAGRYGLESELMDPQTMRPVRAEVVVEQLLGHLRPVLEDLGDHDEVRRMAGDLLRRGSGATEQRASHRRGGRLESVVTDAVRYTLA